MSRALKPWMYMFICQNSTHHHPIDNVDAALALADGVFKGTSLEAVALGWRSVANPHRYFLNDPPVLWFCPVHAGDAEQFRK